MTRQKQRRYNFGTTPRKMDLKTLDADGRQWTAVHTSKARKRPVVPAPKNFYRLSVDVNGPLQTHANKPLSIKIDGQKNVLIKAKNWRVFVKTGKDRFSEIH